jgi:hypothetical protein
MAAVKKKVERPLLHTELMFVKEYIVNGCNATKAYKKVFPKATYASALTAGPRMFGNVRIKTAIEAELCKHWQEKDLESAKGNLVRRLKVIADAMLDDVIDVKDNTLIVKDMSDIPSEIIYALGGIDYSENNTETGSSKRISVKLCDKLKAIEMMAKIIKILDPKSDIQQVEIILKEPDWDKKEIE